jgi:hypothetical protein
VVVAGSRAVTSGPGKDWGISIYTPVIVKYRDAKTDAKIQLEDLRSAAVDTLRVNRFGLAAFQRAEYGSESAEFYDSKPSQQRSV